MEIGIAQLATLLTAAGVAIYVLGLVGLALSINLTFAEKWSTAWYAVSLMPRTVVAGQGMRIWREGWIRIAISVFVYALLAYTWVLLQFLLPTMLGPLGLNRAGWITVICVLVLLTLIGPLRSKGREWLSRAKNIFKADAEDINAPRYRRLSRVTAASFWAIGVGVSISGGYLAYKGLRLTSADGPANWDLITVAFLVFLVGAFFVAIPAADRIDHPLPMVMLIEAGEATPNTVGWLVAHSDGYWHLFDSRKVLLSVPDERVIEARVDDPGISEQLEASRKSTEQRGQAPPQKSSSPTLGE